MILNLHRLRSTDCTLWQNLAQYSVKIHGSVHQPPEAPFVSEEIEHLCEYVNDNWSSSSAVQLAAYVL
jgi:hypothetical protein